MNKIRSKKEVQTTAKQYHSDLIRRLLGTKGIYNNPVQESCPSKYAFDALYGLGANKWHHIDKVIEKTIQIMSSVSSVDELSQWDAFITRRTKKDIDARLRLKALLCRLIKYHEILTGMGCSFEIKGRENEKQFRLNIPFPHDSSDTGGSLFHEFCLWLRSILSCNGR